MNPRYPNHFILVPKADRFLMTYEGCDIYRVFDGGHIGWLLVAGHGRKNYCLATTEGVLRGNTQAGKQFTAALQFLPALAALHQ